MLWLKEKAKKEETASGWISGSKAHDSFINMTRMMLHHASDVDEYESTCVSDEGFSWPGTESESGNILDDYTASLNGMLHICVP